LRGRNWNIGEFMDIGNLLFYVGMGIPIGSLFILWLIEEKRMADTLKKHELEYRDELQRIYREHLMTIRRMREIEQRHIQQMDSEHGEGTYTGSSGTFTPEQFEQYLRLFFNCGKRKKPKLTPAQHKARKLLKKLLPLEEWKRFQKKGYFVYIDKFKNRWEFINRFHYPIIFNDEQICISGDDEAPIEDLLIQCYLEVKGGRGDKLLKGS